MDKGSAGHGQEAGREHGFEARRPGRPREAVEDAPQTAQLPQQGEPVQGPSGTPSVPSARTPQPPPAPPEPPPEPPVTSSKGSPPKPAAAPETGPPLADWLGLPRPEAEPGIWRCGYEQLTPEDPDRTPTRQLVSGALVTFLIGWLIWSLLWNGYLGSYWLWPMLALTPESWRSGGGSRELYSLVSYCYYALVIVAIAVVFGRIGRWNELARRAFPRLRRGGRLLQVGQQRSAEHSGSADPSGTWAGLRAGAPEAAERLTVELRDGLMGDVDHARIERAWQSVRTHPDRLPAFTRSVLKRGAGACLHPSGERDLPARAARHDLSLRQVRIGTAADQSRNPQAYRGAGLALDPALLGTCALVVGPAGSGKSTRLVRPVVESLCLQALAGQAAVVAVTAAGSRFAPDEAFDAVVRLGRSDSVYDLDLYGGTSDPDEAAGMLAEALVGDLTGSLPGGDSRRAATALAQVIGPFQAVHGRFPYVPELRELLDGSRAALDALRAPLTELGQRAQVRELDAYERQAGRSGEVGALLADRVALLDRPAFAEFFTPAGADGRGHRPFSLRALEHPLRVRVDLPEGGHAEASRIFARLLLAQFTDCAVGRADQSLFACLVLDDAAQTVSPQSLRNLQRLRSGNAGALLTLRALDEVPDGLRGPLLGAVGCRMVCAGVTPWDAEHFAEAWGTEWVQTRDVTNRQLVSDEPFTRFMHGLRRLATGRHVTAESVTVRTVQRERWSASDLANELPPRHAVISLTTVRGDRTPPVLTRLEE